MFWYKIVEWFRDRSDRQNLILKFNATAKESFILGIAPVLLNATPSRGDSSYKHAYSHWLFSGFRIKAMSGRNLTRDEMKAIGATILADSVLVRRLVVLGFDTLEVHDDIGMYGLKWQLKNFIAIAERWNYYKSIHWPWPRSAKDPFMGYPLSGCGLQSSKGVSF